MELPEGAVRGALAQESALNGSKRGVVQWLGSGGYDGLAHAPVVATITLRVLGRALLAQRPNRLGNLAAIRMYQCSEPGNLILRD